MSTQDCQNTAVLDQNPGSSTPAGTDDKLVEAIRVAHANLVDFRAVLLTTGQDEVSPAPFHYLWSDIMLNGTESFAIQGFRESAKGQYVLRSMPLYCLRFPSKRLDYIVLIKQNQDQASAKLLEIEEEYLANDVLKSNLMAIKQRSGKVFSVDVIDDATGELVNVRIEAYGKGAAIRGLANQDRRPKLVLIDDPQDSEDARSDTVLDADWKWFASDVKFLGQKTRIFLIGNNLGDKCLIERVIANANDFGFKTARIGAITPAGEAAWPQKFGLEFLNKEREEYRRMSLLDVWQRERMCEAVSEESRIVTKDDMGLRFSALYMDWLKESAIYFTIDPASSTSDKSCYRAITINAVREDNRWFILDIPFGRWRSDELLDVLFENVSRWHPTAVGIEKGEFKQVWEPFVYREMQKRKVFFDIVPIEHAKAGSKLERVKMLGPRFKAKQIWLPESAPWLAEFEAEMLGVTIDGFKSLFVDLVDSLAMQQQIAKPPSRKAQHTYNGAVELAKARDPYAILNNHGGVATIPHRDPTTFNPYH